MVDHRPRRRAARARGRASSTTAARARSLGIAGDMTRPEDVERAVGETIERFGAHRRARHLRGLARRAGCSRTSPRSSGCAVAEPQVHGLRALLPRRAPAHARARQRQHRARGRQRRPQAELLGDDGGRRQRGRPQLRVLARRAVRPRTASASTPSTPGRWTPTAGTGWRRPSRATRASTSERAHELAVALDPARAHLHARGGRQPRRLPRLAAGELRQRRPHPDRRRPAQGDHGRRRRGARRGRGAAGEVPQRDHGRRAARRAVRRSVSDVERVAPCLPGARIEGRDGDD